MGSAYAKKRYESGEKVSLHEPVKYEVRPRARLRSHSSPWRWLDASLKADVARTAAICAFGLRFFVLLLLGSSGRVRARNCTVNDN